MSRIVRQVDAVPAKGLLTRRRSSGGFPASPFDGRWRGSLAQWEAVKAVADALPGTPGMGGWTIEREGFYPGARRMLAYWAAAPVTAVAMVQAGVHAGVGMAPTLYAAAAAGTALIVRGAHVTLRAEAIADARARAARLDGEYGEELVPFNVADLTDDLGLDGELAPVALGLSGGGRLRLVHDVRWHDSRPARPVRSSVVVDGVVLSAAQQAPATDQVSGRRRWIVRGGRR